MLYFFLIVAHYSASYQCYLFKMFSYGNFGKQMSKVRANISKEKINNEFFFWKVGIYCYRFGLYQVIEHVTINSDFYIIGSL